VIRRIAQRLARITNPEWQCRRVVDNDLPPHAVRDCSAQRGETIGLVAIALQLDDAVRQVRLPASAVEQRDVVSARGCIVHLRRPGEAGAAEYENTQGAFGRR
jgi:hypothetical protein